MQLSELLHQQIFRRGDHFHLLLRRTACLAMIVQLGYVGRWIATVSYSIGIVGAACLCVCVGGG